MVPSTLNQFKTHCTLLSTCHVYKFLNMKQYSMVTFWGSQLNFHLQCGNKPFIISCKAFHTLEKPAVLEDSSNQYLRGCYPPPLIPLLHNNKISMVQLCFILRCNFHSSGTCKFQKARAATFHGAEIWGQTYLIASSLNATRNRSIKADINNACLLGGRRGRALAEDASRIWHKTYPFGQFSAPQ